MLALLAERAGTVVSHDDIARHIWGEATYVNFRQSIHYGIRQIRSVLGDTTASSRVLESLPRRGYRLRHDALVPLTCPEERALAPRADEPEVSRSSPLGPRRRTLVAASLAVLIVVTLLVERRPNNHHEIAVRVLKTVHDLVY